MSTIPGADKKILAGILGIVLGWTGAQRFVLGDVTGGILRILLTFFCGVGAIIGLIEGIIYLTMSDEDFVATYIDGDKAWF